MNVKRPLPVTIIAWLYIAVGALALVTHTSAHGLRHPIASDYVWVAITELAAIAIGVLLLYGRGWARWLALLWMGFHVVVSWPVVSRLVIHSIFLAVLAYFLFRPGSQKYFPSQPDAGPY